MPSRKYPRDLTGLRFERLSVLSEAQRGADGHMHWSCACDCGNQKVISGHALKRGATVSCGCLGKERRAEAHKKVVTKHGLSKTKQYVAWQLMIDRCHNPNSHAYSYYGARGIKVCPEWRGDYGAFYAHVGERPDSMSLDRINNNGNYEPGNVRWADRCTQARNTRANRLITVRGKTQTLMAWAEASGIAREKISARLNRGWAPERAVAA